MQVHNYRGFAQLPKDKSENEKAVDLLQRWVRAHTQMVRNWGYFSQVKTISKELYGHFDEVLEAKYGFSATNSIDLFQLLIDETERASTNQYKSMAKLYKLKDKKKLIFGYHELMGLTPGEAGKFINKIDIDHISLKSLFVLCVSHYEQLSHENYEFLADDVSTKLHVDEATIKKILDEFSYGWGALESHKLEYLHLSNPVWHRPIIKITPNKYFCVLPQMFFSFIIPSMERLIGEIDKTGLSDRRASYLEEKIVEIVNQRFPESNTVANVKWKYEDVEYETDLITFIDSHAIIVEAKSGKVTDPALRGAPDRLKKHVQDILVAPNIQSKRLKERLEELILHPEINDTLRDKLPIDLNRIHQVIRVSVSFENFSSLHSDIAQLSETGWLPDDFDPCPAMTLADFETLFDFLDHPVQIVHYLTRRQELEGLFKYVGDELDLMGLYIETLFNVGNIDQNLNTVVISGMSSLIDSYYNSRDAGVTVPKPKPKISPLFVGIFEQLEQRQTPRWTEIGVILNRFSPDDQRQIMRMVEELKGKVRGQWMVEGHENIVVCVPPKASEYALCYVVYNNNNAGKREEFIQKAGRVGLEAEHVKHCLVIAKNMDKVAQAYHFIGLME